MTTVMIRETLPAVEDFLHLRVASGMTPRSRTAAERGLPRSLYAVIAVADTATVGMGRVVGDGGCNFEIVDVAVAPDWQRQGIGRRLVTAIMAYLDRHAPPGSYISLIADVPGLYEPFGFRYSAPRAYGMHKWQGETGAF